MFFADPLDVFDDRRWFSTDDNARHLAVSVKNALPAYNSICERHAETGVEVRGYLRNIPKYKECYHTTGTEVRGYLRNVSKNINCYPNRLEQNYLL